MFSVVLLGRVIVIGVVGVWVVSLCLWFLVFLVLLYWCFIWFMICCRV